MANSIGLSRETGRETNLHPSTIATAGIQLGIKLLLTPFCMFLAGCVSLEWEDSRGNLRHYGAFRYSLVDTATARVFVREAMGLDLRLTSLDPGVSLGYRKSIAAQSRPLGEPIMTTGGYFWLEEQLSGQASLLFKKLWGAELGFSLLANGLSVGLDTTTLIVGPRADESAIGQIYFDADDLHTTVLYLRSEERP